MTLFTSSHRHSSVMNLLTRANEHLEDQLIKETMERRGVSRFRAAHIVKDRIAALMPIKLK